MRVKQWMSANPVTIAPGASVAQARRIMLRYGVRHLPVVTEDDRLLGLVCSADALPPERHLTSGSDTLDWNLLIGRSLAVETVMRQPVAVTDPEEHLAAATNIMLAQRLEALPVISAGMVVGVLSASDCLRGLLDAMNGHQTAPTGIEADPDAYKAVPYELFA